MTGRQSKLQATVTCMISQVQTPGSIPPYLPWLSLRQPRALPPLGLSKARADVLVPGRCQGKKLPALLQLRRARAWFPCVDTPNGACTWDLRFTVPMDCMAVSSGQLLRQVRAQWADQATTQGELKHNPEPVLSPDRRLILLQLHSAAHADEGSFQQIVKVLHVSCRQPVHHVPAVTCL